MTDEQLLDTLCCAWGQAMQKLGRAAREQRQADERYWLGVVNGLACGIAAVSGIPDKIGFMDTVRAGHEIARARQLQ